MLSLWSEGSEGDFFGFTGSKGYFFGFTKEAPKAGNGRSVHDIGKKARSASLALQGTKARKWLYDAHEDPIGISCAEIVKPFPTSRRFFRPSLVYGLCAAFVQ